MLLGFVGYKAGMTHVFMIDDRPNSPNLGKEIFVPVTVIETPPLIPLAVRGYTIDGRGELQALTEYWIKPPKELDIKRKIFSFNYSETRARESLDELSSKLERMKVLRVVAATQPRLVPGLGKKRPDVVEIQVTGGQLKAQLDYVLSLLGKPLEVKDVLKEGQLVDLIGVSKGKGFQGAIKRFGVMELPRWHKHRKGSRKVGTRGPSPGTPSYTPQPGQLGYFRRTEFNKRILKISNNVEEVNPKGGFISYGLVRNWYVLIEGSVIGTKKRPIFMRYPIRPTWEPRSIPQFTYVSTLSKQGVGI
ncbi:50S ribosomal protein L3 [Sulfodiicoccus acidiphilus]|uniref:50S ribosomal protein L3 n=1 Tax=Sulfodiicoccus acidiphilus TaxID=1670455 RepID=A0A348B142_9CREN|nr:50S ribosomal protein L3 [Sulfodiicoccus acidiphilus]GGT91267.1 50S ribosomal protein L3 [Sulfodiicoccus acidiphilus]